MACDILPHRMNPLNVFGPEEALYNTMACCNCDLKVTVATGVLYWAVWDNGEKTSYGPAFFCSITCILEVMEPGGHA